VSDPNGFKTPARIPTPEEAKTLKPFVRPNPVQPWRDEEPSILVSFAYRRPWARMLADGGPRPWREVVLDSGAFTVWNAGGTVDINEFGDWVLEQKQDPKVTEVFTLDVIGGDWRESLRNTEALWKRGIEAIPVFHVGEPQDVLVALCRDYPKVALGGAVGYRQRVEWAALCFKAVWPKKLHGLGFGETSLAKLPFHTIDNSSWTFGPSRYGDFHSINSAQIRGSRVSVGTHNVRCEIDYYLKEEGRLRRFWDGRIPKEWGRAPHIRLATGMGAWELLALRTPPGQLVKPGYKRDVKPHNKTPGRRGAPK
jgi:hypothetical protein